MLVVGLMAATALILLTMVLAWSVYSLASLKKHMVYVDELNGVVEQLNALTYAIHRAHMRNTQRLDANEGELKKRDAAQEAIDREVYAGMSNLSLEAINNYTYADGIAKGYVRVADFGKVFEDKYFRVDGGVRSFNLAASEVVMGPPSGNRARLRYAGSTLKLGDDDSELQVADTGLKFCSVGPKGLKTCSDVAMKVPTAAPTRTPVLVSKVTSPSQREKK